MLFRSNTDADVTIGSLKGLNYLSLPDGKGKYKLQSPVENPIYSHNSNIISGIIAEIACDLSNYVDYEFKNSTLSKEPTLSKRVIFEIRPAAEMAAKLDVHVNNNGAVNGSYLENYEITAPVGKVVRIGTEYAFTGSDNNYYYTNGSVITKTSNYSWRRDGGTHSATIQNNRVLELPVENAAKTVVYTLVSNGRGVAKFTVNYKNQNQVGPSQTALVSETDLQNNYRYINGFRFDGKKNAPVEWDESGYGFYYQDWGRDAAYRTSEFPGVSVGEYTLLNEVPSTDYPSLVQGIRDMKHKYTGATDGNFLYIDGDKAAGTILNLKFNDGTLCPGTRMYVSAWINNLGTGSNPNLNFSVIGIRADGTQHVISTYTTGDLDASVTRGEWHQLFFTLNMPNIDYVDYRLHVMNNAQTALGNDFAIDDICVYMQKPALMAYQADVDCSQSNDESVVMVRIDYNTLNAIPTDEATKIKSIYYHFQDEAGIA